MCVTSPAVASTALGVPDLVNGWMVYSHSEGHRNMWVLPGWFIKDKTDCERRSLVTDGVENNICRCPWQILRRGCHCRCAQDHLIEWTFRVDANVVGNHNQWLPAEGFVLQEKKHFTSGVTQSFHLCSSLQICFSLTVWNITEFRLSVHPATWCWLFMYRWRQ